MFVGALLSVALLPLGVAIVLDLLVGDPREGSRAERWYPPVLVGRLALALDRRIARGKPPRERRAGVLLWTGTVGLSVLVAGLLVLSTAPAAVASIAALWGEARGQPSPETALVAAVYWIAVTGWLASCFTLSGLLRYCSRPLGRTLEEKRELVAQVVNRPTDELSDELLNSALIESAAENTTDSVVGPLLGYALFGLPGAVAYRSLNTLDALLGHRDRRRRYVGEASARIDHAVNLLPDRLTALLLRLAAPGGAPPVVQSASGAAVPASIVAAAQVAGVRLERKGSYVVGPELPPPTEADVRRVLRTVKYAGTVVMVLTAVIAGGVVVGVSLL